MAVDVQDAITGQQDLNGGEAPAPAEPPVEELRIDGTTQLGMLSFGGKKPTSASLTITGGKFDLMDGRALNKGDTIVLRVVAVVDFVGQKDKTDRKTGIVTACEQQHKAYINDVELEP